MSERSSAERALDFVDQYGDVLAAAKASEDSPFDHLQPEIEAAFARDSRLIYHPFLFGSKRTGPDLARVGKRYSDEWHRVHLINPRSVVPESNMPGFPWLSERSLTGDGTPDKLLALSRLGVPYSDEDIEGAADAVEGKTEMAALIAYLQQLGTHLNGGR